MIHNITGEIYYHINTGQKLQIGDILEIGKRFNNFYYEIYNIIRNSLNFKNLYFGFITEMYPQIDHGDQRLVYVFHQLMNLSGSYKLSYETISEENKKLYLIKKK